MIGDKPEAHRILPAAFAAVGLLFAGSANAQQLGAYQAIGFTVAGAATALRSATPLPAPPAVPSSELPVAPSAIARPLLLPGIRSLGISSFAGGVPIQHEQPKALPLTIDQAVSTALKSNTEIIVRGEQERFVQGEILSVGSALLPNLQATAYSRAQEINLAAMGFKPNSIKGIPGFSGSVPEIVKVNTTSAQLSLSQSVSAPALFLYQASKKAAQAANWATLSARGGVVLQAGALYLQALADQAQVQNAEALVKQDQLVFDHAKASKDAGVGINLDVLRAQVQLQNDQQQLIRYTNAVAKDKLQLNRVMGQPAGQQLTLTDSVPFAEFDADQSDEALQADLAIAFERRKDLRGLESQLELANATSRALKYERLPVVGVGGYYGVIGQTTGLYHGTFVAEGKISIPVFLEAELRGQREVAAAQQRALRQQIDGLKSGIEGDIRASLLDVQSAREQVKVARSNVELAAQALDDATQRFTTGVDDNLPVVRAQASLENAQSQVVQTEFQYNYAKLQLARNTGVVETEYRRYLGR